MANINDIWKLFGLRYKSHPWHGIAIGKDAPRTVTSFIEMVSTDTVKYEIDKETGYLKVDRPQKFSSILPALYGFVPQTYCGDEIAALCNQRNHRTDIIGDGDPVDICVLTEKQISHGNILIQAVPIGGFRMIDGNEADDKIIAVMQDDEVYKNFNDITDLPPAVVERLRHYFLTYKDMPGHTRRCEVTHIYGREEAHHVLNLSMIDYKTKFGKLENKMTLAAFEAIIKGTDRRKDPANKK